MFNNYQDILSKQYTLIIDLEAISREALVRPAARSALPSWYVYSMSTVDLYVTMISGFQA